jgi:hypothetical protein
MKRLMVFLICVFIGVVGSRFFTAVSSADVNNQQEKGKKQETEAKESKTKDSKEKNSRHDMLRAVVFRVYNSQGAPVHGAEILIRSNSDKVKIPPKLARGRTVKGLRQTYVPCSGANFPSQNMYKYEVWSAEGKTYKGYWWQSMNSWVCNETLDITIKLKPPLDSKKKSK